MNLHHGRHSHPNFIGDSIHNHLPIIQKRFKTIVNLFSYNKSDLIST